MLFLFSAALSALEVIRHECESYQAFGEQELLSLIDVLEGSDGRQLCRAVSIHCGTFPCISCAMALPKVLRCEHGSLGHAPWRDLNDTSFGNQAQGILIGWLRLSVVGAWELCFCAVCLAVSFGKLKDFSGIVRAS